MRFRKLRELTPKDRLRHAITSMGVMQGREEIIAELKRWVAILEDRYSPESLTMDVYREERNLSL